MSSEHQIQYNAPWHDLKHVCVGSTYLPEFYEPVRNSQVRDGLQTIAYETNQDYNNLVNVLLDFGIQVDRCQIDTSRTIMDYVDSHGKVNFSQSQSFTLIPRPPMQPRDSVLIVGQHAIMTNDDCTWFSKLNLPAHTVNSPFSFDASLVTVIGDTIICDCRDHVDLGDFLAKACPRHRIVPVHIGGHNDAVFSVVAPGLIISTYHHTNYADSFPGWEVKYIDNQSWNAIPEWRNFKHSNHDKWWVPESHNNAEFANFVNTWLNNWVGFVAESVFDINMLQINQNCVLVNNYNSQLFEYFKSHQIEPIIVPFRHRFFWDGGLHCITNDIYREGPCESYF